MGSPPRSLLRLDVKNIHPFPPPARELPSTHRHAHPLLPRVLSSPSSHLQRPYSEYALQHVFSSSNAVRRWHHPCLLRHRRSPRARVARHRLLLAAAAAATTGLRCSVGRRRQERGGRGGRCSNVLRRQVDSTLALPRRIPHAGRWMVRSYPADHDRDIRWLGIARVHRAGERRAYTPLRTRYTVHTTTIMHSPTTPLIHPTHTSHTILTSANHWLIIPALHSNLRPPISLSPQNFVLTVVYFISAAVASWISFSRRNTHTPVPLNARLARALKILIQVELPSAFLLDAVRGKERGDERDRM